MVSDRNEEYTSLVPEEVEILEELSRSYRNGLNINRVDELVSRWDANPEAVTGKLYSEITNEKRSAYLILHNRSNDISSVDYVAMLLPAIAQGHNIIDGHGMYWRFKPCVERILEMDNDEISESYQFLMNYQSTDYFAASEQQRHAFFDRRQQLDGVSQEECVTTVLDTFELSFAIFERGFPLLIALKRITDGESPEVGDLQRMRLNAIIRELSDTENHQNSAYFDLIAKRYPRRLRNGMAHGDLLHDAGKGEVRIPSKDVVYSYDKLTKLQKEIWSITVFFTGMLDGLIEWRHATVDIPELAGNMDDLLELEELFVTSNEAEM